MAFPWTQSAQDRKSDESLRSFSGKWTGTCQDGNLFVILNLKLNDRDLVGDISIANMHGDNGQCAAVIDPPTPEHATKISNAKMEGKMLSFQASSHAHFTMSLDNPQKAQLRFLGTPVENSPWQVIRTSE